MRVTTLAVSFVEEIPTTPVAGVLYAALAFNTTMHLCACGCSSETWVPIRPNRHRLAYNGRYVTIQGSIGNWRLPCRSHYWITNGKVVWADTVPAQGWRERIASRLRTVKESLHRR